MSDRLPRDRIPDDLKCWFPECQDRERFNTLQGFIGHMAGKHLVKFERQQRDTGWLEKLRANEVDPKDSPDRLLPWHAVGIAKRVLFGQQWKDVAADMQLSKNKKEQLGRMFNTKVGQEFAAKLQEMAEDNVQITKALLGEMMTGIAMDWFAAFQWAVDARDYNAVHRMSREIGLQEVLKDNTPDGAGRTIVVHIGEGSSIESPEVKVTNMAPEADWQFLDD